MSEAPLPRFSPGDLVCFMSTHTVGRWFHGKVMSSRKMGCYYMVEDRTGKPARPVNENRMQLDSGRHGPRWTPATPLVA